MAKGKATAAPAPAPQVGAGASTPEAQANGAGAEATTSTTDAADASKQNDSATTSADAVTDVIESGEQGASVVVLPEATDWPHPVFIYNHSHANLACRVSGAHLPAAGSALVHLHDPEHAKAVAESLTNLAAENFIDPSKLVIVPA